MIIPTTIKTFINYFSAHNLWGKNLTFGQVLNSVSLCLIALVRTVSLRFCGPGRGPGEVKTLLTTATVVPATPPCGFERGWDWDVGLRRARAPSAGTAVDFPGGHERLPAGSSCGGEAGGSSPRRAGLLPCVVCRDVCAILPTGDERNDRRRRVVLFV